MHPTAEIAEQPNSQSVHLGSSALSETVQTALPVRQRLNDSFENSMRLEAVVDLASHIGSDTFEGRLGHFDGPVESFVEHLLDTHKAHASMEPLREIAAQTLARDEDHTEFFAEALMHRGLIGLAVQFVTPVMTRSGKSSWSFSWGYTQSTWVYAESYDEAWKLGVAWAEQCRAKAKAAPKKRATGAAA